MPAKHPERPHAGTRSPYVPVHTLNGWTLPYAMKDGVKEFHLVAEEIDHEFAPGSRAKCWGYNGSTPGPTIEAVEGDRIRILRDQSPAGAHHGRTGMAFCCPAVWMG